MADNIFGFKFSKQRQKWPSLSMFESPRTDSRRMTSQKTEVIGLQSLAAKRRILFLASGKILYLQRNDSVSWCTIFGTEI